MIDLVRNGMLVAASGIHGHLRDQVKGLLEYYRLETENIRGKITRVATPVRMWAERPDGSIMFYAGYAPKICGFLQANGAPVTSYRRLDRPEPLAYDLSRIGAHELRPEQIKMIEALATWEGGQIVSGTGTGNSFVCARICRMFPAAKIVFAAPTIDTVATLKRYLTEHCGEEVGQVGGGRRFTRRVTCSTYDSILNVSDIENIDILVVDECHRAAGEEASRLFSSIQSPRKRFGLTATDDGRSDKAEWMIEGLFGPVIVDIPYQYSVQSGSVVPLEIVAHVNPYGPDPRIIDSARHQADKDRIAIWMNRERNALIARDVQEMHEILGAPQTLILVDKMEHLVALQQYLPDFEVAYGDVNQKQIDRINKKAGFQLTLEQFSGDDRADLRKRFESGEAKKVLATSVFATGVSSNHCGLVAVASGSGASIAFRQSIGRGSRTNGDKAYAVCLMWQDTFHRAYHGRAKRLIQVAKDEGHRVTIIPITAGMASWTPPS
jgi:superfamily II DNA or RNA helicase